MNNKTIARVKQSIIAIAIAIAFSQAATAQVAPVDADGNKITGTWNVQITQKNCADGTTLFTFESLFAYSEGGVMTEIPGPVSVPPTARFPSLGVWERVAGRNYRSSFKFFRYNADGSFAGKTINVSDITHEDDDTLNITGIARTYNAAGDVMLTRCVTVIGTRFTGEN